MGNKHVHKRIHILIGFAVTILLVYSLQLFKIQIIDNEKYIYMSSMGGIRKQIIKAARGDIVDRNGVVIASNKTGFDVIINKAFMKKGEEINTILNLTSMMKGYNVEWIDILPLSKNGNKFIMDSNGRSQVDKLVSFLNLDKGATEEIVWQGILKKYKLTEYSKDDARTIAGVLYSMDTIGYTMSVPYIFAKDVSMDLVVKLKENSSKISGVEIVEVPTREYVLKDIAPHIIGKLGPIYSEEYADLKSQGYKLDDMIGKDGIEKCFEKYLRGKDGERHIKIDFDGNVEGIQDSKAPVPGDTVMLTIDSKLQRIAQQALEDQIKHLNVSAPAGKGREADSGSVVVLDVRTGEILAIATYPSYDITEYNKKYNELILDPKQPLFNRALNGLYAPGSCYKPCVAVAALSEGVATPTSIVHCGHVYNFFSGYKPRCLGNHGDINVMDALKYSCNIFFYDVGRILGIDKINKYSKKFGLGEQTGIQLPEKIGQRASPELRKKRDLEWYAGDVVQASIGQSDNLFSPLQLANYISTIANRGKRMKVSILKNINSYHANKKIYEHKPEIVCDMKLKPEIFETVIEGLTRASRSGTARATFGNYPITVPSKTGTPETVKLPNSTFICFAPDKDSKIAISVVIEKGWHGYTGAPVAKKIIQEYFFPTEEKPIEKEKDSKSSPVNQTLGASGDYIKQSNLSQ